MSTHNTACLPRDLLGAGLGSLWAAVDQAVQAAGAVLLASAQTSREEADEPLLEVV